MKRLSFSVIITSLFGSVLIKLLPIVCSYIVLYFFSDKVFSEFVYFLIFSSFIMAAISSGLVPSMLGELTKGDCQGLVVKRYLIIMIGLFVFIVLLTYITNELHHFLSSEKYFYSILSGLSSSLVFASLTLLQFKKYEFFVAKVLSFVSILFLVSFFALILLSFDIYFSYSVSYFFSSVIILFFTCFKLDFSCVLDGGHGALKGVGKTFLNVGQVYIPNLFWMLVIFVIHSSLKYDESYPSFAMGYQLISILTFAPIALTPIMIRRYGEGSLILAKNNAIKSSLWTLFLCFALSFSVFFIVSCFFGIDDNDAFLWSSLSSMFVAGLAPLSNYLIIAKKHYMMLVGSLSLFIIFVFLNFIFDRVVYFGFFSGYMISYFLIILGVYKYA